jgi:hypothetical protein
VTSQETVRFLAFSRQYGEPAESTKFLNLILGRSSSRAMLSLVASVPTNGFSAQAQYRKWIENQSWLVDEALEWAKEKK